MKIDNLITDDMIAEWKQEFGRIYKTTIGGEPIVWRKLKRKEYVAAMNVEDEEGYNKNIYARQEFIAKTVILFPANVEELIEDNAGLATCISDECILKSGFDVGATQEM